MVKQGSESREFFAVINKIEEVNNESIYAQQIREYKKKNKVSLISNNNYNLLEGDKSDLLQSKRKLTSLELSQLKMMLAEIKEMQKHIKYSYNHIQKRIKEIENKLNM